MMSPQSVAFAEKREVDRNYVVLMKTLLDKGAYPAIATHDETIVGEAFRYARERKIRPEQFEFRNVVWNSPGFAAPHRRLRVSL